MNSKVETMEENPYAAPESSVSPHTVELPEVCVDGEYLVVSDGAVLPSRCVFTNEPVSGAKHIQTLKWLPAFRLILRPEHGVVEIAVSDSRRKRRTQLRLMGVGCQVLGGVLLYQIVENAFVSAMIVAAGVVGLLEKPVFLPVVRYDRNRFWLKGCGAAFLQSCRDEFGVLNR